MNDVSAESLSLSNGSVSPEPDNVSNSDGSNLDLPDQQRQQKVPRPVHSTDDIFDTAAATAATLPTTRSFTSKKKPFAWLRAKHKVWKDKERALGPGGDKGEDLNGRPEDLVECSSSPDLLRRGAKIKKQQKGGSRNGSQEKFKELDESARADGSGAQGDGSGRLLAAPPIVRRGSNRSHRKESGSDASPVATPVPSGTNVCSTGSFLYSDDIPLLAPVPETWIKHGYLMLRMKLPNNRYAWTYIVRMACHMTCIGRMACHMTCIVRRACPHYLHCKEEGACSLMACHMTCIVRRACPHYLHCKEEGACSLMACHMTCIVRRACPHYLHCKEEGGM